MMHPDRVLRGALALALAWSFTACGGSGDDDDVAIPADSAAADESTLATEVTTPTATDPAVTEPEPAVTDPTTPASEPTMPPPDTSPPDTSPPITTPPITTPLYDPANPFRDDFDGSFLESANWAWSNEDPSRWRFEDGTLVITGADPHFMNGGVNFLTRELPEGVDIGVSVQLSAVPQENFEAAGLTLVGDENEYMALVLAYCDLCLPDSGGVGIFAEAMRGEDNLLAEPMFLEWDPADEVTLILEWSPDAGAAVGGLIGPDGEYQQVFRLDSAPEFTFVGLAAHNLPGTFENTVDIEAHFDWFELVTYP
jgi:hypothetical protein